MTKMEITLIQPRYPYLNNYLERVAPGGILTVASLTPKEINVSLVDERFQKIDYNSRPDIVGLSAMTPNVGRAYEIANKFRLKGVFTVLGGPHATALPEEAVKHVDAVVVGEAENLWPQLLRDYKSRTVKKIYDETQKPCVSQIPFLKRDRISLKHYSVPNIIEITRGCPFSCSFCEINKFYGRNYRVRPIDGVIHEISKMKSKYFAVVDNNLFGNKPYCKELFSRLKPLRKYWFCSGSINALNDEDLLSQGADAGLLGIEIRFESLSSNVLSEAKKIQNLPRHHDEVVEHYKRVIRMLYSYRISVWGNFICGFDCDGPEVFDTLAQFLRNSGVDFMSCNILTPMPGTSLFKKLDEEGRIFCKDWEKYMHDQVNFNPKQMNLRTLRHGSIEVYEEFYSLRSIFCRFFRGVLYMQYRPVHILLWLAGQLTGRKRVRIFKSNLSKS